MPEIWAYDYPAKELVQKVINVAAAAGYSNSGLVIDLAAGHHLRELSYLEGVLLARLDNVRPPLGRMQTVRAKADVLEYQLRSLYPLGECRQYGQANPLQTYVIERIFYEGEGRWSLQFRGDGKGYQYQAEHFEAAFE